MTEFVKEPITLTITEIDSVSWDELITIESLEKLFIEKYLKQMHIPVPPKDTEVKESIEVSLEEKNTLDIQIQQIKMDPIQSPSTASGYGSQQIQIKQPIKLLHPRFIQIPKQYPRKYISHLRKMF